MEFLGVPGVSFHGAKHKVRIRFICRLVARQLRNNAHATKRALQQLLAHEIIGTSGVFYDSSLLHAAFDVQCLCRPSACGAETSFGVSSAEIQNKLAGASCKIHIVDAVCRVSSPLRSRIRFGFEFSLRRRQCHFFVSGSTKYQISIVLHSTSCLHGVPYRSSFHGFNDGQRIAPTLDSIMV